MTIEGRAKTPAQKREVVERILAAWLKNPEQRLGQLIDNAICVNGGSTGSVFYTEDSELALMVEEYPEEMV